MLAGCRLVWRVLVSWPALVACGTSDTSLAGEHSEPCAGVTLLTSTEGPLHAGTPVTLTAIAECPASSQPRYWFRALREGTASWVDVAPRDTSDNQVEWDTNGLFSGRYRLA